MKDQTSLTVKASMTFRNKVKKKKKTDTVYLGSNATRRIKGTKYLSEFPQKIMRFFSSLFYHSTEKLRNKTKKTEEFRIQEPDEKGILRRPVRQRGERKGRRRPRPLVPWRSEEEAEHRKGQFALSLFFNSAFLRLLPLTAN